jgi:hypothetical protein
MFLLGLAAYLYEPIASMTNPPVNCAYPRTADGFIHLLTRGQFERINPTAHLARFLEQLQVYANIAANEYGLLYFLASPIPFFFLRRLNVSQRRWVLGLVAVYLSLVFFLIVVLNHQHDRNSREFSMVFYSASHLVLAVWTGCGLVALGVLFVTPRRSQGPHRSAREAADSGTRDHSDHVEGIEGAAKEGGGDGVIAINLCRNSSGRKTELCPA